MENHLSNSISMLQSNPSAAISHMQEMLEKEASIITYTAFSLDDLFGIRDLFEKISDADGNILYEVDESDYR